jgi:hypothetical protein
LTPEDLSGMDGMCKKRKPLTNQRQSIANAEIEITCFMSGQFERQAANVLSNLVSIFISMLAFGQEVSGMTFLKWSIGRFSPTFKSAIWPGRNQIE